MVCVLEEWGGSSKLTLYKRKMEKKTLANTYFKLRKKVFSNLVDQ